MARRPKNDTPVMRTVRASGHRSRAYRTDVGIRDFDFIIDEPEKLGGENLAPTPMEYVTGALSGCFVVTLEMVSEDQEFNMIGLDVECEGVVDHRGLFGTANVSPHFQSAKVDITIVTDEPTERHAEFKRESLVRCPVYNLIKDSGVDIPVNWTFKNE